MPVVIPIDKNIIGSKSFPSYKKKKNAILTSKEAKKVCEYMERSSSSDEFPLLWDEEKK